MLSKYESTLLQGWEEVHKKGQLSLWILLALKDGAKHMASIKTFIERSTNKTISADDQSMYRALRRFDKGEMISFSTQPSESGPDKKVYELTQTGRQVLDSFIERNIEKVFFKPANKKLFERS